MSDIALFCAKFQELAGFSCDAALLDNGTMLEVVCEHKSGRFFAIGLKRGGGPIPGEEMLGLVAEAVRQIKARFAGYEANHGTS